MTFANENRAFLQHVEWFREHAESSTKHVEWLRKHAESLTKHVE